MIKDKDYARAMDGMGFCVASLFSQEQIAAIREVYAEFVVRDAVKGLIASHSKMGAEKNLRLRDCLKEIIMPSLELHFSDFDFFIGGFMVKEGGNKSELPLHQDWCIVDESLYRSYQIWVPLELSHPANGGMFVLPGSQTFFSNYRSGSYGIPVIPCDDVLRPYTVDMNIAPGQALVFHNSLFHASYPNHTDQHRVSAIISIYTKGAPITYYHKSSTSTEAYTIDSDIFLSHLNTLENGGTPPIYHGVRSLPLMGLDNKTISSTDLTSAYENWLHGRVDEFEPRQREIIRDESLRQELNSKGYAVLDFLDDTVVQQLANVYNQRFPDINTDIGRFTAMEHVEPASKREIHDLIIELLKKPLDRLFENYQTPIASFLTKYACSRGDLDWHNDASLMLNTNLEPHYGIWCPLLDVNENNGAFCLIEGSHKFSHQIYVNGVNWPFIPLAADLNNATKVVDLKAGQIVLFDLRLIHNATPNNTAEHRVVVCVRLTHQRTQYYSFHCTDIDSGTVAVYEERGDFYLRDDWSRENQAADRSRKAGQMQNIYAHLDMERISRKIKQLAPLHPATQDQ